MNVDTYISNKYNYIYWNNEINIKILLEDNMKKIISLMLVLSVAFSALALSGCDGDKREENGQKNA